MAAIDEYTMIKDQLGEGQVQLYKQARRLAKREEVQDNFAKIHGNMQWGLATNGIFDIQGQSFSWNTAYKEDDRGEGVIAFTVEGVRIFDLYSDLQTINVYHARVCVALLTDLLDEEN